jgi:hypothetical protein
MGSEYFIGCGEYGSCRIVKKYTRAPLFLKSDERVGNTALSDNLAVTLQLDKRRTIDDRQPLLFEAGR